jgi:hypothetical protein
MYIRWKIHHCLESMYNNADVRMKSNFTFYKTVLKYNLVEFEVAVDIDDGLFRTIHNVRDLNADYYF